MKKILLLVSFVFLIQASANAQILTATDQILYDNYGINSGHSYSALTVTSGDSQGTVITLKTGYSLLGVSVLTTKDALISFYGSGLDCVEAQADSSANYFNPENATTYFPIKNCTNVRVANSSGESLTAYITIWAKRK